MKKTIYILTVLISVLSVSSCDDWLKATSSTQFQADQIYETRDGYLDALTGVYLTMGNSSVYGSDMTWNYIDLINYPYESFTGKRMSSWQNHDYSYLDVRSNIETIWRGSYNIIANANMVLSRLDEGRHMFSSEVEFNLVKGELLAIRAYVHFDLMRMFGTTGFLGDNASKLTVPYVTTYNMTVTGQLSNEKTMELLLNDLEEALRLLAEDPVTGVKPEGWDNGPNSDGYWNKRQRHFNLYAAEALAARIYHWNFDLDKAAEYASKALDGALSSGLCKWLNVDEFVTTYKDEEKDWTFSTEHIFGLEITGLSNLTMGILIPGASNSSDVFHLSALVMDIAYNAHLIYDEDYESYVWTTYQEGTPASLEDIRGESVMLKYSQGAFDCYKLYGSSTSSAKYRNIMPMLRLSEMCYIIAEKELSDGDSAKALEMLDQVRLHRGFEASLETDFPMVELEREVFKEFLDEGQGVFWRRHMISRYNESASRSFRSYIYNNSGIKTDTENIQLTLPYPDAETDYGRKQEL